MRRNKASKLLSSAGYKLKTIWCLLAWSTDTNTGTHTKFDLPDRLYAPHLESYLCVFLEEKLHHAFVD